MKKRGPINDVSDHALVRYLELHHGVDVEALRRRLLCEVNDHITEDPRLPRPRAVKFNNLKFLLHHRSVVGVTDRTS